MNNSKPIKCVVSAINSNGEPDFYFVIVMATEKDIEEGNHYEKAKTSAENEGYEPFIVYDQFDSAFRAFSRNAFSWKTATIVQ